MALTNREIGNAWISYILGELYDEWPRRRDFDASELATKTGVSPKSDEDDLFDHTVDWLRENGYIRVGSQSAPEGTAFDVGLTDKGYAVLGSSPESLSKPIGIRMKEVAAAGASEGGKAGVAEAVGALVGFAFKAALGS
ncbi:hypothetical protein [Aminobacter sp. HY435]|uniref:hypothetical protein n=1 Tax=Aminobacter sp. HY435 TaxID=2970917 RepID=UPI0022B9CDB6|nr:hypothetical protein [Aminobacter sp. HY435]